MLRHVIVATSLTRQSFRTIASRFFGVKGPSQEVPTLKNIATPMMDHINDSAFFHQRNTPTAARTTVHVKFKSPRKRANIMYEAIQREAQAHDKANKPAVWGVDFRVGDAIEIDYTGQGGIHGTNVEKLRGVVLGRHNRGMDTAIYLRDVLYGSPVERKIPLHNPLVKAIQVLQRNFVYKGRRKIKRAKLYFLRKRNPTEYRITGVLKGPVNTNTV